MTEEEELRWEQQRLIADLLTRPGTENPNDTLAASHLLAESLAGVVRDCRFWDKLQQANADVNKAERQYLAYLVRVSWTRVLQDCKYTPPPPADDVAATVTNGIAALVKNREAGAPAVPGDAVDQLRSELEFLVKRLNGELAAPQEGRGPRWWRKLKHLAGVGLEVLRHVNLTSLAFATAEAAVVAVIPVVVAPFVMPVLVAAAVTSIAAAASAELRAANQRLRDEQADEKRDAVIETMDSILTELHKSNQSCTTANNQLELRGKQRPPGLSRDQVIDGSVKNFRTLETQVATVLPSAWVYFGAQMGYEGRRHIEETSKSKDGLHAAITAFEAGRNEPGTNAEGLLAKIRAAATTLAKSITSLRDLCLARGVASQTGW